MTNPTGKVAFVTGGASGIGLGISRALAAAGAAVAIADIEVDQAVAAARALSATGVGAIGVGLDVADHNSWGTALEQVEGTLGPVGILCCNAGVGGRPARVEDIPFEDWRRVFSVNCDGVFLGVRTVLPGMRSRRCEGHVVVTSSTAALAPAQGGGAYAAAKAAVWTLSEVLRQELQGSGINVSILFPGMTRTGFAQTTARAIGDASGPGTGVSKMLEQGADPDALGQAVVEAIVQNRFDVLVHSAWKPFIAGRFATLLESIPPEGILPDEDVAGMYDVAAARLAGD